MIWDSKCDRIKSLRENYTPSRHICTKTIIIIVVSVSEFLSSHRKVTWKPRLGLSGANKLNFTRLGVARSHDKPELSRWRANCSCRCLVGCGVGIEIGVKEDGWVGTERKKTEGKKESNDDKKTETFFRRPAFALRTNAATRDTS